MPPTNKKILITGTAGFIGFHLAKRLAERGDKVVGLDNINDYYDVELKYARLKETGISRNAEQWKTIAQSTKFPNYRFIRLNLEDSDSINELFKKEHFDMVVNLAAQPGVRYSIKNPKAYIDSNIVGFFNILEACRHNGVKNLIYASSSSVYGNNKKVPFSENDNVDHPISLYAATKKSNELMAYTYSHLYNIKATGLRFFTVYGPWGRPDMAPILFASAAYKGRIIKVFNHGKQARDFTYIDDIIDSLLEVIDKSPGMDFLYQLMNIGNGKPVQLMDFISAIETATGKTLSKEFVEAQPGDVAFTHADTSKLQQHFRVAPKVGMKEGVEWFIDWYRGYFRVG